MRPEPQVIVHVGMNKTGSTALQQHVFPVTPGIEVVANRSARVPHPDDKAIIPAVRSLCDDDEAYSPGLLGTLVARVAAGGRTVLLTDEAITSTLRNRSWSQLERTVGRLAHELPTASIIVVFREPATLIHSTYAQYVRGGGTASLSTWADAHDRSGVGFEPRQYDLAAVHRLLDREFGGRVHALLYEQLVVEPKQFVCRVLDALHVGVDDRMLAELVAQARHPANVSLSPLFTAAQRASNRLLRRTRYNAAPLLGDHPAVSRILDHGLSGVNRVTHASRWPVNRRMTAREAARCRALASRSGADHRWLGQRIGMDLQRYGYAV